MQYNGTKMNCNSFEQVWRHHVIIASANPPLWTNRKMTSSEMPVWTKQVFLYICDVYYGIINFHRWAGTLNVRYPTYILINTIPLITVAHGPANIKISRKEVVQSWFDSSFMHKPSYYYKPVYNVHETNVLHQDSKNLHGSWMQSLQWSKSSWIDLHNNFSFMSFINTYHLLLLLHLMRI